jgi:hypothetical protein
VYSVTSRGEVLLFDPEAARNSGEEESSVVGQSIHNTLGMHRIPVLFMPIIRPDIWLDNYIFGKIANKFINKL